MYTERGNKHNLLKRTYRAVVLCLVGEEVLVTPGGTDAGNL
jgi:hypothetical protein